MRVPLIGLAVLVISCGGGSENSPGAKTGDKGLVGGDSGSEGGSSSGNQSGSSAQGGGTSKPAGGGANNSSGSASGGMSGAGVKEPPIVIGDWKNCGCVDPPGAGIEAAPESERLVLEPGVLTHLGPPVAKALGGGSLAVAFDPNNPGVIYAGMEFKEGGGPADGNGIWRSLDGGKNWKLLGEGQGPDANAQDHKTAYLDLPTHIRVDPCNSKHLIALEGVRGKNNGYWVSCDGGDSWIRPPAFVTASKNNFDMSSIAIDPEDWTHQIVGSHSSENLGVLETTDAGESFQLHLPPKEWGGGTAGMAFLFHPESKTGDIRRWLVHNPNGHWLSTNAGETWENKSKIEGVHGATETYYTAAGVLYGGAKNAPVRSRDNGETWEQLKGFPYQDYYTIIGDGTNLYTMPDGYPPPNGFMMSPEGDGDNWTQVGGSTVPERGPYSMMVDHKEKILYAAHWAAGVWAMKLP